MKKSKFFTCLFIFISVCFFSQPTQTIKFSKKSSLIYFFQIGNKSDTIRKNKSDLFFLVVPDTLKEFISIQLDNGKLEKIKNDSTALITYLPGIKYESIYVKEKSEENQASQALHLKTFVNGAAGEDRSHITIRFYDRRENLLILENIFVYQN